MIKFFGSDIVAFAITSLCVKIICASNIVMLFWMGWKIIIRGPWKNILFRGENKASLNKNMSIQIGH